MSVLKKGLGAGKTAISRELDIDLWGTKLHARRQKTISLTQELLDFLSTINPDPAKAIEQLVDDGSAKDFITLDTRKKRPVLHLKGGKE